MKATLGLDVLKRSHVKFGCGGSVLCWLTIPLLLAGCATDALELAPSTPDQQWTPPAQSAQPGSKAETANQTAFALSTPGVYSEKTYTLPTLIDLAQRNNPSTRNAWERARQAALAVGMAEATYLPIITANVVGGIHHNRSPLPIPIGAKRYFDTEVKGIMPSVALQWLVFDFGGRSAIVSAAEQVSLAANYQFNLMHQKVVLDVTRNYHNYNASRQQKQATEQAVKNSRTVLDAALEKRKNGVGTVVEVAQAEQALAQAKLRLVTAKGAEQDAYQALLAAIGISPTSQLRIEDTSSRKLPTPSAVPIQTMVDIALDQRPDIRAGYATLKAARSGIDEANSAFLPKVGLYSSLSTHSADMNAAGLPSIGARGRSADVFIGATVPLYDSGLRAAQLKAAESRAKAAELDYARLKDDAAREIVIATNALTTALEAQQAANALVKAAWKTYDATVEAYRNGLGTVTAAAIAQNGLLDAQIAEAEAHAAAFTAAANLAFVLGASQG
ncbi:TolC family protein [Falsochrobactrum ovis]|uniref:Protein CyaE n=1 Tax=Falsochrobactrum ovis TaxID=1293442 RepID=A0A364JTP0_9HYPH|nr:TolC family protein [Falsochrobactrum ovis]RAK27330.1 outer membrane protein TolC [Falsochrobactrum ovis]